MVGSHRGGLVDLTGPSLADGGSGEDDAASFAAAVLVTISSMLMEVPLDISCERAAALCSYLSL
jgi:hypothetical protein